MHPEIADLSERLNRAIDRFVELKYTVCSGRYAFEAGLRKSMMERMADAAVAGIPAFKHFLEHEAEYFENQIKVLEAL